MDRVVAVSLEIIGKTARTADPGDAHRALRPSADLRQGALHRLEDRIIAAARAPAHLLIRGKIGWRELGKRGDVVHRAVLLTPAPNRLPLRSRRSGKVVRK